MLTGWIFLVWMGIIGGTYVTHGECYKYKEDKDTIYWAKGGYLRGESWKRIAFLRKIIEDGPGPLEPADISRDFKTATTGKGTYIIYFGKEINNSWSFHLPQKNGSFQKPKEGTRYTVEIIDTWNMTVQLYPQTFQIGSPNNYRFYDKDKMKIPLPNKPYIALRITEIN